MPDTAPHTTPVIAMVMGVSAITLAALAALIYAGVVPLPPETRLIAAAVMGAAAFADFLAALWFFRKSQSS